MALGTGVQSSGGHMVDADGVPVVRVDGAPGGAVQSVESSGAPLLTAATYFSTSDARNGQMQTYTEQRASDAKTRTVTITRDTTSGSITAQSATAWA